MRCLSLKETLLVSGLHFLSGGWLFEAGEEEEDEEEEEEEWVLSPVELDTGVPTCLPLVSVS